MSQSAHWAAAEIYTPQLPVPTLSAPPEDALAMLETSCPLSDFLRHGDSAGSEKKGVGGGGLHGAISLTFSEMLINDSIELD